MAERNQLVLRPELEVEALAAGDIGEVQRPLSTWERVTNIDWVRRVAILVLLAVAWELYGRYVNNPLMVPTFTDVMRALWDAVWGGPLLDRIYTTLKVLVIGYGAGLGIAAAFTAFAVSTRIGTDLLATLTAMFNPLPAIALLPLALLWFGLGTPSLVFVIIHSVLWAVALNTHSGFLAVSETMRMAGHNYGLRGIRFVAHVLMPAALPAILAGMKIGWAFAWRTLIAAELVFGTSSGGGGLGWFIYENKNVLDIPAVFAGLFSVIIIGLLVENLIFRSVEARTIRKWGMHS
jgi:NitT/TauT family transport system permease protein